MGGIEEVTHPEGKALVSRSIRDLALEIRAAVNEKGIKDWHPKVRQTFALRDSN